MGSKHGMYVEASSALYFNYHNMTGGFDSNRSLTMYSAPVPPTIENEGHRLWHSEGRRIHSSTQMLDCVCANRHLVLYSARSVTAGSVAQQLTRVNACFTVCL